jgi:WD repeat-containing protein 59
MHELSVSPSASSRAVDSIPRLFQSPALLSEAMHRLAAASSRRDQHGVGSERSEDGNNILHIMTNLLTLSRLKQRRASEQSRPLDEVPANYSLLPTRVMTVYIRDMSYTVGASQCMASKYVFDGRDIVDICSKNAELAQKGQRHDHERFFNMMTILFSYHRLEGTSAGQSKGTQCPDPLVYHLVMEMFVFVQIPNAGCEFSHYIAGTMGLCKKRIYKCWL